MSTVIAVLHVVCAVFIVGPMAILPMTAMRSIRAGEGSQVVALSKSTRLFSLLSLLVIVFGFGAMGMSEFNISFGATWIWLSILLYVVALGLALFLIVPVMQRTGEALRATAIPGTQPDTASPGVAVPQSGYAAIAAGSGITTLCLLVIVILMVWKP